MLDFLIRDHYNLYATIMRYLEKIRAVTKENYEFRTNRELECAYYLADPDDFGSSATVKVYSNNTTRLNYSLRHNEDYQVLYVYLGIYSNVDVGNKGYYQVEIPAGVPYSKITGAIFNVGNIGGYYFDLSHIKTTDPLTPPSIDLYNDQGVPVNGTVYPLIYYIGKDYFDVNNNNISVRNLVHDVKEIRPEFETNGVEPEVIPELADLDDTFRQWETNKNNKKE